MKGLIAAVVTTIATTVPIFAETVITSRTIRAKQILSRSDLRVIVETIPGMADSLESVVGMEAKRNIYAGRPVSLNDIGPPALVDRNQIVSLAYRISGLTIKTDGRALGRGGLGDRIRVINLESRTTVSGKIDRSGTVWVGQ